MRLPIILVAAATLLICTTPCVAGLEASGLQLLFGWQLIRLSQVRLDYGPVVLMHVFQASILALWFSYRDGPKLCEKPDKI
jgi:hypothetical protein